MSTIFSGKVGIYIGIQPQLVEVVRHIHAVFKFQCHLCKMYGGAKCKVVLGLLVLSDVCASLDHVD